MTHTNPYANGLDKNPANFVALSPLSYLARTAKVYPDRLAIIYGEQRQTWGQTYTRCCKLAGALSARGIGAGDTVAVMDNGVVIHHGAMADLAENETLQRSLLGLAL